METTFAIQYTFFDESHETELSILVNDANILSFYRDEKKMTTRWNLDELALWLRCFLDNLKEDPYPVEIEGEYASIKDINAREFDTEDDAEFDVYYDKLDDWDMRHRWHPAFSGGILADLYFQLIGENIEISWNNQNPEEGVKFQFELGGVSIPKERFISEVNSFLEAYAMHWF